LMERIGGEPPCSRDTTFQGRHDNTEGGSDIGRVCQFDGR
jgi:hypothetical protein